MSEVTRHPLVRLESLALVAIGGFAGSNLRYFAALVLPGLAGTLAVNVVGSFALGFVLYERLYSGLLAKETRVVVSTGFLSSFTTYSTFALQSAQAPPLWLVVNVVANYTLGFSAVLLGRYVARLAEKRWSQ
ncbi:chromosome condensation protein CrcB [Haloprofundus marisrubri]|uniref:Fluoride-specific ion channel FluC n=1 Tax=Haloprofundus marisrubri TaxID=1514971 RepID=A0A0W1RE35_9EURY|nr:CrcB family protein [Haloprofundus marisrubri]KTG11531.1 chromosome condensation protein CrcB [Haloprofundus marisrubri]